MRPSTRIKFNQYLSQIQQSVTQNFAAIDSVTKAFPMGPLLHDEFEEYIFDQSAFLKQIQRVMVMQLKGEKIQIDIPNSPMKRTTVTNTVRRGPGGTAAYKSKGYDCAEYEFDPLLEWSTLDHYATRPNFSAAILAALAKRLNNDRQFVAFNGVQRDTDVAIGDLTKMDKSWLLRVDDELTDHYITEIVPGSGKITITDGVNLGDYANIDHLVADAYGRIPQEAREEDCVVLLHDKWQTERVSQLYKGFGDPSEKLAIEKLTTVGGRPPIYPAFFPEDAVMVTPLSNLSIYIYNGEDGWRRYIEERQDFKGVIMWNLFKQDYIVQDPRKCFVMRNVQKKTP